MKLKWKDEAVSPVIATILMVAITVVLTAVLYVMVVNLSSSDGAMTQAPVGSWQSMSAETNSSAKIIFGSFQPGVTFIDIRLIIEDQNGRIFNISWSPPVGTKNFTLNCDDAEITAYYFDYNPSGGNIGSGDYIIIYGLDPFTNYYVRVYNYPSDSIIEMAGTTSFQTAL